MKAAAIYPGKRRIALAEVPEPRLCAPDEVLVRMLEVGICGTDRELARFEYGAPPDGQDYLVIGHEGLGQVEAVGPEATRLRPGDLVVPTVRRPCGQPDCTPCAVGRQDYCFTGQFTERGIQKRDGFMAERIVEQERYLHRVPPQLKDLAVLTEPLTICRKALRLIFDVQDRLPWACPVLKPETRPAGGPTAAVGCRKALVLGAGPVGLLGALTLADAGFETFVYSRVSGIRERVEIAEAIGCKLFPAEDLTVENLHRTLGKVDVVFEAVGASALAFEVLRVLHANSIFVFTGVPGRKAKVTLDTAEIMRNLVLKNQALVGTVNAAPEDFDSAIQALGRFGQRWPGVPERLKTESRPIADFPELMQNSRGIKSLIRF